MNLNVSQLGADIVSAFKGVFEKKWPEVKEYAEAEAKKLAQTLVMIEGLKKAGKINEEQASLYLAIQKNAARTVMLTLEGLGILMVEAAINSALDAVKKTVNTALGFVLL